MSDDIVVYVDIVGDLFHHGHARFLERARSLGTKLIVGVCGDDLTESYKRRPVLTLDERVEMVRACRWADEVIADVPCPVPEWFILEHGIDIVAHGDDFDPTTIDHWYGAPIRMGRFRTIPYTPGISTSDIIRRIVDRTAAGDL